MASPVAVLSVLVTANTGSASASLTKLDRQLKGTGATAEATGARVAKGMKYAALGVTAAAAGSVYAAAKFESAFAEVRKTVEANEKGYKRIELGLRNLSKQIPVSANELANLAGEAGALGVKSKDIVKFTKTASQLGTTTDLAATDAATALARLSNIMDTKGKKAFQRMGSTLVDLGNKGASTEEEISSMALRIAGAGKTLGLSEANVLGLSSALANVGIEAEMGGSAISRVMLQMNEAIAKGGPELQAFAEISGQSANQFVQSFEHDAPGAIAAFSEGLGKLNKAGEPLLATLKGVELGEIRVRDTLLRIAGNTDNFTDSQKIANKAWRENNALTDEAKERYATLESQLTMLKNSVVDVGIGIGQELMPDIKEMVAILRDPKITLDEKISQVGEKLGDMIGEWGPKVAEAGGKLGLAILKGIGDAFLSSDILGKLFIGAGVLRLFGGPGVFTTLGTKMGTKTAGGFKGGMATGLVGIGVAAGLTFMDEFQKTTEGHGSLSLGELFQGDLAKISKALDKAVKAKDVQGLAEITDLLSAMRESARRSGEAVPEALDKLIAAANEARNKVTGDLWGIGDGMKDLIKGADAMADNFNSSNRRIKNSYKDLRGSLKKSLGDVGESLSGWSSDSTRSSTIAENAAKRYEKRSGESFEKVGGNATGLSSVVTSALQLIATNTNKSLKAYGVKEVAISLGDSVAKGAGKILKKQRGGPILTGDPSGDSVPALLERGEYVLNRNAVKGIGRDKLDAINFGAAARFQKGGSVVEALGPYAIDPFSYDANHAGGNSHWHIAMSTTPAVVAVGKKLQQMGFMVGEHPAFGGVNAQHSATGYHYSAQAIDVNSSADETEAETRKVAAVLNGSAGRLGAAVEKLQRVILEGPDGPLKSMGQGALDKVHKAASAFIESKRPSSEGLEPGAGKMGADIKSLPDALKKYNRTYPTAVFPSEAWNALPQLPFDAVAALAEWAGRGRVPGVTMAQLSNGEGNRKPGSESTDGGHAMWGYTPRAAGLSWLSGIKGASGPESVHNPIIDAQVMAKMYPSGWAGGSPWYGSGDVTDYNAHYSGPLLKQLGGIIGLAGGGGGKKSDNDKAKQKWQDVEGKIDFPGFIDAGSMFGAYGDPLRYRKVQKLLEKSRAQADRLAKMMGEIDKTDERINIGDLIAGIDGETSPAELAKTIDLHKSLYSQLVGARGVALKGDSTTDALLKLAKGKDTKRAKNLSGVFNERLEELQGLTGGGGRILDTFVRLAELGQTVPSGLTEIGGISTSTLREIAEAANLGVFDRMPEMPVMHNGGVVPGPRGADVPIMAQAGERVIPADQPDLGGWEPYIANWDDGTIRFRRIARQEIAAADHDSNLADRAGVYR